MGDIIKQRVEYVPITETEVKILNIDIQNLGERLASANARLTVARRLISDTGYKDVAQSEAGFDRFLSDLSFAEGDEFLKIKVLLRKLGFDIEGADFANLNLKIPKLSEIPKTIRIREDGNDLFLTLKFKPKEDKEGLKVREEHDIKVVDKSKTERFLTQLGFEVQTRRQKYRTTYEVLVGDKTVKVELNEGPLESVKPWIEIEGESGELITQVASNLGFSEADFRPISDSELYKQAGLTDEERKNIVF